MKLFIFYQLFTGNGAYEINKQIKNFKASETRRSQNILLKRGDTKLDLDDISYILGFEEDSTIFDPRELGMDHKEYDGILKFDNQLRRQKELNISGDSS